jgi:hypothetical protein
MRTVVGVALVGMFVASACGGSSSKNEEHGKGGSGSTASMAGTPGIGVGGGGGAAGGKQSGGATNVAGSSPVEAGAPPQGEGGGSSFSGAPGLAGAGGDVSGEGGAFEGGAAGAAGAAGQSGEGGGPNQPVFDCDCEASEACIKVTVTRDANISNQPWVLWPTQTDGTGTLTVSASAASLHDKVTLPAVSFVAADSVQGVALCVPAGATNVRAFLDEEELENPNGVTSSHYLDSCAPGAGQCFRCYSVTATAGAEIDLAIALKHSCD